MLICTWEGCVNETELGGLVCNKCTQQVHFGLRADSEKWGSETSIWARVWKGESRPIEESVISVFFSPIFIQNLKIPSI